MEIGVITYTTSIAEAVVFISVSVMVAEVCPLTAGLLMPANAARLQLKVAIGSFEVIV